MSEYLYVLRLARRSSFGPLEGGVAVDAHDDLGSSPPIARKRWGLVCQGRRGRVRER